MTKASKQFEAAVLTNAELFALRAVLPPPHSNDADILQAILAYGRAVEMATVVRIAESFERDGVDWVGRAIRNRAPHPT